MTRVIFLTVLVSITSIYAKEQDINNLQLQKQAVQAFNQRKYSKAIMLYTRMINQNPDNYDATLARGITFLEINKLKKSESDLKHAIKLKPDANVAYTYLALLYSKKNDFKNFSKFFEAALQRGYNFRGFDYDFSKTPLNKSNKYFNLIRSSKSKYIYKTVIDNKIPFHELKLELKHRKLGIGTQYQARIFHEERKRLGENFEKELFIFLNNNINYHYWISSFLASNSYLYGNRPLFKLALKIKKQGIELCKKQIDVDPSIVGFAVTSAIIYYKSKKYKHAVKYKVLANHYINKGDRFRYSFPALSRIDSNIYNSIRIKK